MGPLQRLLVYLFTVIYSLNDLMIKSNRFYDQVEDLCGMLAKTSIDMKKKCLQSKVNEKKGTLQSIKEFFLIDDTTDFDRDRERQRIIDYMDQTVSLLTDAFKVGAALQKLHCFF